MKLSLYFLIMIVSNFEISLHCVSFQEEAEFCKLSNALCKLSIRWKLYKLWYYTQWLNIFLPPKTSFCIYVFAVAQTQILSNQQEQVLNPASLAMPNPSGPSGKSLYKLWYYTQWFKVWFLAWFWLPKNLSFCFVAAQRQIPDEQLYKHLYASKLALSDANGISGKAWQNLVLQKMIEISVSCTF